MRPSRNCKNKVETLQECECSWLMTVQYTETFLRVQMVRKDRTPLQSDYIFLFFPHNKKNL